MKTETKSIVTLDAKEYEALSAMLYYISEEVSDKKKNNYFTKEQLQSIDDMYMSI